MEAIFSPPILFFILGFFARYVGTNLRLPEQLSRFFSIYLLLVIGFEGGVKLSSAELGTNWLVIILVSVFFALFHPLLSFMIVRKKLERDTAIALSASYGSVSVVTFIAALAFLDKLEINSNPQIIAALAIMEFPAIFVGVLMHSLFNANPTERAGSRRKLLHEAVFGYAPLILVGSLIIGMLTGEEGSLELEAFTKGLFKGFLSLFLLDLGAKASAQLINAKLQVFHILFGLVFPLVKGCFACFLFVYAFELRTGDALLMSVLFASASYIAVPAAMETMLPGANRGIYVTLPLAITFPFNVIVGIPLYFQLIKWLQSLP